MKFIFICGGTCSGIGKGIIASNVGLILQNTGLRVTTIKVDPYLNIDAGTMSPYEHGEVFVLDDGGEADLDLGNYERFLNIRLTKKHSITSGKLFQLVLDKERQGKYLGKTVQFIPHLTEELRNQILEATKIPVTKDGGQPEVCIIELGGTVGDIESALYLEAIREMCQQLKQEDYTLILVGYVPVFELSGEQKSKPTQHAAKELRSAGLTCDFIACRCREQVTQDTKKKIAQFTNTLSENRLSLRYSPPKTFQVDRYLKRFQEINVNPKATVNVCIVGKYIFLKDCYISIHKALEHASVESGIKINTCWIEASHLGHVRSVADPQRDEEKYKRAWETVKMADGIIIPGGFGLRGVLGKIDTIQYVRENKIPLLGLCYGLQTSVVETCMNVLKLEHCYMEEGQEEWKATFKETKHKIINYIEDIDRNIIGGTMRLGAWDCEIKKDTLAYKLYGSTLISERHRHRYEVNNEYVEQIQKESTMIFSGQTTDGIRKEIAEITDHPFFFTCQFHPELKSTYFNPSPPFLGFVLACAKLFEQRLKKDGGTLVADAFWQYGDRQLTSADKGIQTDFDQNSQEFNDQNNKDNNSNTKEQQSNDYTLLNPIIEQKSNSNQNNNETNIDENFYQNHIQKVDNTEKKNDS